MSLTRTSKRLVSLDVLRGITVCGMILVNNAGACGYAYAPLKHAKWDGFTPADLVFPAFMFIMGVSIYLSLNKSNFDWRVSIARILRRTVLIFVSGVALKWILAFIATGEYNTLENLRIMGVLQRLGICYGIVALLAVTVRHRLFPTIIAVLLVGYYLLQLFGNGFEKCAGNIVSMVDYAVLGKSHMYLGGAQFVDPEGILSTIPAIAQVMIGFLCGKVIVGEKEIRSQIVKLAVWGTSVRYRVSVELCRSFEQTAVVSEFRFGNLRYHLSDFCNTHLYYRRFEEDALVVSVLGSRRKSVIDLYIQRNCRRVIP